MSNYFLTAYRHTDHPRAKESGPFILNRKSFENLEAALLYVEESLIAPVVRDTWGPEANALPWDASTDGARIYTLNMRDIQKMTREISYFWTVKVDGLDQIHIACSDNERSYQARSGFAGNAPIPAKSELT